MLINHFIVHLGLNYLLLN